MIKRDETPLVCFTAGNKSRGRRRLFSRAFFVFCRTLIQNNLNLDALAWNPERIDII